MVCVAVGMTSCKAWRTISTTATYTQVGDSTKTTTTIVTKTQEEYQGTRKQWLARLRASPCKVPRHAHALSPHWTRCVSAHRGPRSAMHRRILWKRKWSERVASFLGELFYLTFRYSFRYLFQLYPLFKVKLLYEPFCCSLCELFYVNIFAPMWTYLGAIR